MKNKTKFIDEYKNKEDFSHPDYSLHFVDFYRLNFIKKYLIGNSILDVGCGKGYFLDIIKNKFKFKGIEINRKKVEYLNKKFKGKNFLLADINNNLDFKDNEFDTVTCLEVLEHLDNPQKALEELIRVARKRIILSVPYNQKIDYILCKHCAKYTPTTGHLHIFNEKIIKSMIPVDIKSVKIKLIYNKILSRFPFRLLFKLPNIIILPIDNFFNIITRSSIWMVVILDKK